jgi:hypothetical protein
MNCSNCQNPIQEGEKFCGKCGSVVKLTEVSKTGNSFLKKMANISVQLNYVSLVLGICGVVVYFSGGFFVVMLIRGMTHGSNMSSDPLGLSFMNLFLTYNIIVIPTCALISTILYKKNKYTSALVISSIGNLLLFFVVMMFFLISF